VSLSPASLPRVPEDSYLRRLHQTTNTHWWHDSADPLELRRGLDHGAVGVTTNPYLAALALAHNREAWKPQIQEVLAARLDPEDKAEHLMHLVVGRAAAQLKPEYERSEGHKGVSPGKRVKWLTRLGEARRMADAWLARYAWNMPAQSIT